MSNKNFNHNLKKIAKDVFELISLDKDLHEIKTDEVEIIHNCYVGEKKSNKLDDIEIAAIALTAAFNKISLNKFKYFFSKILREMFNEFETDPEDVLYSLIHEKILKKRSRKTWQWITLNTDNIAMLTSISLSQSGIISDFWEDVFKAAKNDNCKGTL